VQVVDLFQIHAAAARALLCDQAGKLTTKTLHSELVFNLSGTRNVAESFRRFGISDKSDKIVLCVFDANESQLADASEIVHGTSMVLKEIGTHLEAQDLALIRKYYKIPEAELKTSSLIDAIASRIATKSCSK
jgi:EKC/KEOPS complex subunit CGI121/TPRKB